MRSIGPLFGVAQHLEAWTNQTHTENAQALLQAWALLLHRHHFQHLPTGEVLLAGGLNQLARQLIIQSTVDQFDEPPFPGLDQIDRQALLDLPEFQRHLAFHQQLIAAKLAASSCQDIPLIQRSQWAHQETRTYLHRELRRLGLEPENTNVVFLDRDCFPAYRARIAEIQTTIYEPARQTPIEKFDALMLADAQMTIVIEQDNEIIAMIFAGPIQLFPDERGVSDDPEFDDPATYYVLDLTVLEAYRGGLGRVLKQAVTLYAACLGNAAIHGRNRDRYARGMWAINLSLGSFPTRFLLDDYPDDLPHRDCIYYRCPVSWRESSVNFSRGRFSPLGLVDLVDDWHQHSPPEPLGPWMSESLPLLVANSRWDPQAQRQLDEQFLRWFPDGQGKYQLSSQRETLMQFIGQACREYRPHANTIVVCQSELGSAVPKLRSLESEFELRILSPEQILAGLSDKSINLPSVVAVWMEPFEENEMQRLIPQTLTELLTACRRVGIPTVSDESMAAWSRYDPNWFLPCLNAAWRPEISVVQLIPGWVLAIDHSGQLFAAAAHSSFDHCLPSVFAWQIVRHVLAKISENEAQWRADWMRYDQVLSDRLRVDGLDRAHLHGGVGNFSAPADWPFRSLFDITPQGNLISCPAWGDVRQTAWLERLK